MNKILMISAVLLLFGSLNLMAQVDAKKSEVDQIAETLMDYIDGTANGEPDRLRQAFHPDFNLYTVTKEDSLRVRSGQKYISYFEPGKKSNRIGRIISIDFENNAATAKAEITFGDGRIFIDYFLLLKYLGKWKIIQKSYTQRELPVENKSE